MKVKISKMFNGFSTSELYKVVIKKENTKIKGTLEINYVTEVIEVDMGRKLSDAEKLKVLKHIFYKFCRKPIDICLILNNEGRLSNKTSHVETFIFMDVYDNTRVSVIEELLKYPATNFNEHARKERIIANIVQSYNIICNKSKSKNKIELQPIFSRNCSEIDAYSDILSRYLRHKEYEFTLKDITSKYAIDNISGYYFLNIFEYEEK
jgi:hypothetical protein